MMKTKIKLAIFLCTLLALSMIFGGCSIKEDSVESRELCETMVNHIIQNNYTAAYAMMRESVSQEEFDPIWQTMCDTFRDSQTFELKQKGWHKNWSNGVTTTQVLFEITTDDGKICQMAIITTDTVNGIWDLGFLDSTDFVRKTQFFSIVNIFLCIFSLACFAFSIWMLIDCLKNCKKNRNLWAVLTLIYLGFFLKTDGHAFEFKYRISVLAGITNISADRTALAIAVNALLPIGAIVYFLLRKRLREPAESVQATVDTPCGEYTEAHSEAPAELPQTEASELSCEETDDCGSSK